MVRGLDQKRFKLKITSMILCVSMDIRLMVSPTDSSFLDLLLSTRDFLKREQERADLILMPMRLWSLKYWELRRELMMLTPTSSVMYT